MSRSSRWSRSVGGVALLVVGAAVPGLAQASPPAGNGARLSPPYGQLLALSVVAPDDVWAAGTNGPSILDHRTYATHWDGKSWKTVPTPHPGVTSGIEGIDAVSSSDIWAAGQFDGTKSGLHGLVMHWDGTHWKQLPFPNSGMHDIHAVAAISADDVWVAGTDFHTSLAYNHAFVGYWDGTTWTIHRFPPLGRKTAVSSISAVAADNVTVAGWFAGGAHGYHRFPVTERWDGTTWTVAEPTAPDPHSNFLDAIDVPPTGESWTVGYYGGDGGGGFDFSGSHAIRTLVYEGDGSTWTRQESPNTRVRSFLFGVSALTPDDVWTVGGQYKGFSPLTEHWNGTTWSIVQSPSSAGVLQAVKAVSTDDVWASGSLESGGGTVPYLLHWDGTAWTPVPL